MLLKKIRLLNIVICIITVLSLLSLMIPSQKIHAEDGNKSLTLVCVNDDVVLPGMQWKLYKVGKRRNTAQNFVQTGDFSAFQVNLRNLTVERVTEAAQSFQAYAIANKIKPLREGTTDKNGEVTFTGLDAGLYLLSGKLLKIDSHYYVPGVSLIEIKEDDDNLRYNAYPKFSYQVMNATPKNYTVRKVWSNDEDRIDERPKSVTVNIYRDDEFYDSAVLDESNDWKYRWVDDKGVSSWIVMEDEIPSDYEMKVTYDESRYLIENAYFEDAGTFTVTTTVTTTTALVSNSTVTTTATSGSGPIGDGSATRTDTTTVTTVSGPVGDGSATRTNTATTVSGPIGDGSATNTTTSGTGGNDSSTKTGTSSGSGGGGNGGGSGGGNSGSSGNGKLPQTGQLWWPVVPLSIGGVILIAAGLTIRARKKSDE